MQMDSSNKKEDNIPSTHLCYPIKPPVMPSLVNDWGTTLITINIWDISELIDSSVGISILHIDYVYEHMGLISIFIVL